MKLPSLSALRISGSRTVTIILGVIYGLMALALASQVITQWMALQADTDARADIILDGGLFKGLGALFISLLGIGDAGFGAWRERGRDGKPPEDSSAG